MLLRAALIALAVGGSPAAVRDADAVSVIPDEPGALVLPDAPMLQAVVADLDADGSREVVRLVRGEADAALAEVWASGPEGWALVDQPVQVLPPARAGPRVDPVYAGVPVRMLVHRVGGVERVVVATQPRFDEIDSGPACCLVLHELVLESGELTRVAVAQPTDPVDGILAIDLDGDLTDELLTVTSLQPLGGISFPTDARVYRWADGTFGPPTATELPVGSGDTPFVIGDSDGRPGDEAAFISTLGPPGLFRIMLGDSDALTIDEFGGAVTDATAVPLPDGRGIAVVDGDEVSVRRWPAYGPPEEPIATVDLPGAELIGAVDVSGLSRLLVHQPSLSALHVLGLPNLTPPQGGTITRSAAAGTLSGLPIRPFIGMLPGGGPDGRDAAMFAGRLLPSPPDVGTPPFLIGAATTATLIGAVPVGLVAQRDWMAMLHVPHRGTPPSPVGGRFETPLPLADAWLSIAPLATVLTAEDDDALLDPRLDARAVALGRAGRLATRLTGFVAEVAAPPGSRVLRTDLDPSVVGTPQVVPDSGVLPLPMVPEVVVTPNPRYRTAVIVVTPAGHGYVARWEVQVLTEPPELDAEVTTPFASPDVIVRGRTGAFASVTVDGRTATVDDAGRFVARVPLPPWPTDVEIVATDVVGNSTRTVVTGVGLLDYRALPWIPIVALLVATAGVGLYLRVPRPRPRRPADGDAVLEEIEAE